MDVSTFERKVAAIIDDFYLQSSSNYKHHESFDPPLVELTKVSGFLDMSLPSEEFQDCQPLSMIVSVCAWLLNFQPA